MSRRRRGALFAIKNARDAGKQHSNKQYIWLNGDGTFQYVDLSSASSLATCIVISQCACTVRHPPALPRP